MPNNEIVDKINQGVVYSIVGAAGPSRHKHIEPIYKSNGIQDRGKKEANYAVLRETKMPAILTENGFIDNSNDMAKMKQDWFQNQVAKAHADGIAEFLGLRRK